MSTAVKLDMMPSKDISDYAEKVLLNNPFENFKIENYKYAQLHKSITSNVSLDEFKADLSSISSVKNIKLSNSTNVQTIFSKSDETFSNNCAPKGYMLEIGGGILKFGYRLNNDDNWIDFLVKYVSN